MVYQWDDKEAVCYRLYVEERQSLDEVISYWEIRGFTPRYVGRASASTATRMIYEHHCAVLILTVDTSKRAFQTQFKVHLLPPCTADTH